jgi:RNA-directed DNA polymerase
MCYWNSWKKNKNRHDNLVRTLDTVRAVVRMQEMIAHSAQANKKTAFPSGLLGYDNYKVWEYANTRKGYQRISNSPILSIALTNERLKNKGFQQSLPDCSMVLMADSIELASESYWFSHSLTSTVLLLIAPNL